MLGVYNAVMERRRSTHRLSSRLYGVTLEELLEIAAATG
ncbi:hypothetical protein Amir_4569 [Actinosynnema mirum DSM 43827]|uniref:Uncharacterized protein n=1 Tax=Actinosynnema mirum (strain ATCC 29888 / DSM 43827 / JCM 3225 / NBRC 14064 / NCIMB 13271 / NRRL B-12336 / IMRU 3971 / 101) TaxID=446462 RepID=C6WLL4_ACTMD|nr:hypothetical protein Amir_4569 [Actinosynnema mirum DSM 43827]